MCSLAAQSWVHEWLGNASGTIQHPCRVLQTLGATPFARVSIESETSFHNQSRAVERALLQLLRLMHAGSPESKSQP